MMDTGARFDDHINLMDSIVKARISKLHNLPEYHSYDCQKLFSTLPLPEPDENAHITSPTVDQHQKIPLFYGGEVRAHLDAVNVLGKTAFQMNRNVLTNIVLNQFQTVPALKCLAARMVHKKYFQEVAYQFTLVDMGERAQASCTNFIKYVNGLLTSDFVGHGKNVSSYMHNFEQLEVDMRSPEAALKLMLHYSDKLKLSLELIQFVEMHGPCKFAHI